MWPGVSSGVPRHARAEKCGSFRDFGPVLPDPKRNGRHDESMTESVWDYPRPPSVEPSERRIRVELGGETIVDTHRAHRVLETSHPPVYYVPLEDIASGALVASSDRTTYCEWKGVAFYFDVVAGGKRAERAAWTYRDPT